MPLIRARWRSERLLGLPFDLSTRSMNSRRSLSVRFSRSRSRPFSTSQRETAQTRRQGIRFQTDFAAFLAIQAGIGMPLPALAGGAPVGGAVGVALAAAPDRAAAGGAGAPRALVDGSHRPALGDRALHQPAGGLEHRAQLLVVEGGDGSPGVEAGGEAGLALEDVADPGYERLVEQGVAEPAIYRRPQ